MNLQTDAEIYALPESSDEDESLPRSNSDAEIKSSTKRKREEEDSSTNKRTKSLSKPTRSSQRRPKSVQSDVPPASSFNVPDVDDWLHSEPSQSSSQRRMKAGYGKNSSYRSAPRPSQESSDRLVVPEDIVEVGSKEPKKSRRKGFAVQDSPKSTKSSPQKTLNSPPPDIDEVPKSTAKFSIPDDSILGPSTSTSLLDIKHHGIFDNIHSSEAPARTRSGSTSSALSSTDSIASALLSQSQKDDLRNGIETSKDIPSGYVQCPLCSELVLHLPSNKTNPAKLSLRAQQAYCHTHKLKDAQKTWQARKYPTIDWTKLEKKQIPKHLPHLTKVLLRKQPSFYFSSLESKVKSAKGNKRKINAYLLDGIMDVAKPGYYGARGAKIMSQTIATSFAKQLKMALMQDKIIATAGISGFTSAVLLPELCQRLVMEDMRIADEDDARRIMDESSEVGLLLYPDDDHVELVEAD